MTSSTKTRVAIPSETPGGLNALRAGHFGRCECFTLVDITDGRVMDVEVVVNPPHTQGGCLGPVGLLKDYGVNALVVHGIGVRPLMGFRDSGIDVYLGDGELVGQAADAFARGLLSPVCDEDTCGGR